MCAPRIAGLPTATQSAGTRCNHAARTHHAAITNRHTGENRRRSRRHCRSGSVAQTLRPDRLYLRLRRMLRRVRAARRGPRIIPDIDRGTVEKKCSDS